MYLLDQTWLPFSNLMLRHIYTVLLICSDYDRFMLEEDGRVEEELYKEYTALGLSNPPKITHTSNEEEALRLIEQRNFDLVITMLDLGSGRVEKLCEDIKKIKPYMPIIALSPSPDHRKARMLKGENCPYIDYMFYWQGNASLFLAMIKLIEDRMNIDHDTAEADVQVIILVEDSVRFISSYLPQMYMALIRQNRISILEALNEWGKTLRMRGRPKIILARNFNEAWSLFSTYRENILGVISDVSFPYQGGREKAGLELAKRIKEVDREIPVLIQSRDLENEEESRRLGCDFIYKLSPTLLTDLENHFMKYYNFGPFIFIDPRTGNEIARAVTMKEVQHLIKTIPIESFIYHSKRNDFSRWLRAQSLYVLASMIKHINIKEGDDPEDIRKELYKTIKEYRSDRTRGVIAEFTAAHYDETLHFSRIGKGSMGGKGRGLAFLASEMQALGLRKKYEDILYLSTPRTVVITTEMFDIFLAENGLNDLGFVNRSDNEILSLFLSKEVPQYLRECLKEILQVIKVPISVRSSSLLEDSHFQPFAGVYQTSMIPNRGSDEERLKELENAIKTVWASTYFKNAQEYLKNTDHSLEEEKMAVIIQQITGSEHGKWWFPNLSGVARSLNFYPSPGQKGEDGIGMLSFGFGKAVVDDGTAFRFCPAKPKRPSNNLTGLEVSEQGDFYALDLTKHYDSLTDQDNLTKLPLKTVYEYPKAMKNIFSCLDMATGRLSERPVKDGMNMLTFNGILKYDALPVAKIVDEVLKMGEKGMACPVEIEFAVNTERERPDFSILQIRPISSADFDLDIEIEEEEISSALIYAEKVMGNGKVEGIRDIITIKPENFRASEMQAMARELGEMNASMNEQYLLIAAGRLGSSDRWLGIPCAWSDISKAHVIIETGIKELSVEPSQGTHFFQNMTSLGAIYLTVNPLQRDGKIDFKAIGNLDIIEESEHFLHVRSEKDLIIKVDGRKSKAVVLEDRR